MRKFNLSIIVLISLTLSASCQLKEDGSKQAKVFLTQFDEISKDVDKYGAPYDQYNQFLTKQFTDNDRAPLENKQIDSLAKLYKNYMASINKGVHKLKGFAEFDSSYKVVNANLMYWEHQKFLWGKMGSATLTMYKTGWYNLSADDQNDFVNFIADLKEEQERSHQLGDRITAISKEFSRKYGFEYVEGTKR